MRNRSTFALLVLLSSTSALFQSCSSSGSGGLTSLSLPSDIKVSQKNAYAYISNRASGSVVVLNTADRKLIDVDPGDDFDVTPITVGGTLSAVALDDRGSQPRVFVADEERNAVYAFDTQPLETLPRWHAAYVPVSLGLASTGVATRPIFVNAGRFSSPLIPEISVSAGIPEPEFWKLEYSEGDRAYKVTGSKSGLQIGMATEGVLYQNDASTISFTVFSGAEKTTGGDKFYFGTASLQPLSLSASPVDLIVDGNTLFIVTNSPASVIAFDLDTKTITNTTLLTDGSMSETILGKAAIHGGHLYVPNQNNGNYFDIETAGFTFSVVSTDIKSSKATVSPDGSLLLLNHATQEKVSFIQLSDESLLGTIFVSGLPVSTTSYTLAGKHFAAVATSSGPLDIVDLSTRTRVDTDDRGGVDSTYSNVEFFDQGALSQPEMISITTIDGVTNSERWQMVFEGSIPEANALSVNISGNEVNLLSGSYNVLKVSAGDKVLLSNGVSNAESAVSAVNSDTMLTLVDVPGVQGLATVDIRANQSYVVFGTLSGTQLSRAFENQTYASDDQSISLRVRSSLVASTTPGDFFTFRTFDGINSILTNASGVSGGVVVSIPPNSTVPRAYVTHENPSSISLINLENFRFENRIQ